MDVQGPKKWFATKEGPRQEQAIFSGSVCGDRSCFQPFALSLSNA